MEKKSWIGLLLALGFLVPMVPPASAQTEPYMFDLIRIEGKVSGDVAYFNYSSTFSWDTPYSNLVNILGPPANIGINGIMLDGVAQNVHFSTVAYYIPVSYTHLTLPTIYSV